MRKQILPDIYLKPHTIAEMAYQEEAKFIKLIKENNIKNLAIFKGYEVPPQMILKSGRKVSTETWNPLTYALVLGKQELYNFIVKEVNFNMKQLLEHEALNRPVLSNEYVASESQDQGTLKPLFSLMIENESPFLKYLLNDISYLLTSKDLKSFILMLQSSLNPEAQLEILIQSRIFKTLYYQKVKSISKYKSSFEMFFEKYLSKFTHNK